MEDTRICPPNHTAYDSQLLADNVATAHKLQLVRCEGFHAFPCGDHWHVGHTSAKVGARCKADPLHVGIIRRTRQLRETWQHPGPVRRLRRSRSRTSAIRATIDSEALAQVRGPTTPGRS